MVNFFYAGQKVFCTYFLGAKFNPPKCGKVLFRIPLRLKYYLASPSNGNYNKKCHWYIVKIKGYKWPALVPSVCMEDCFNFWDNETKYLQRTKYLQNEETEDTQTQVKLKRWADEVYEYMFNDSI